ncbi:ATPase [Hyphomicrobium sp. xq]|uniref:ATPase n=1 Tax=Hyphomicrobium album TaxID=2665159 RepID=A0A6I3KCB8_9HYPH|nr:SRPBCC domain-containing protein [Hyphomicrobium album]MTD93065.1 ATPase [Hyphomicrobium album]
MGRIDTGSRIIRATPQALYDAFLDPQAVAQWRPPAGMRAEIYNFDARVGGGYRMAFVYASDDPAVRGKSTGKADVFTGTFVELVPDARIAEQATFESDDPAFAGVMTVTTTFRPVAEGTEVTMACSDVPAGISAADHAVGIASSLANLAAYAERG